MPELVGDNVVGSMRMCSEDGVAVRWQARSRRSAALQWRLGRELARQVVLMDPPWACRLLEQLLLDRPWTWRLLGQLYLMDPPGVQRLLWHQVSVHALQQRLVLMHRPCTLSLEHRLVLMHRPWTYMLGSR